MHGYLLDISVGATALQMGYLAGALLCPVQRPLSCCLPSSSPHVHHAQNQRLCGRARQAIFIDAANLLAVLEDSPVLVVPVAVRAKREGHQSAGELRALVQVNLHAAPITRAKAKTPIATIEPAIMMNQAHMTATDAQPTIAVARHRRCARSSASAIDDVAFRSPNANPAEEGTRPRQDLDPLETCSWRGVTAISWRGVTAILSFGLGRATKPAFPG